MLQVEKSVISENSRNKCINVITNSNIGIFKDFDFKITDTLTNDRDNSNLQSTICDEDKIEILQSNLL